LKSEISNRELEKIPDYRKRLESALQDLQTQASGAQHD